MFTTPCFIRKNTPELREELIQQGHQICSCCISPEGWLLTNNSNDVHAIHKEEQEELLEYIKNHPQEIIDCATNDKLFIAISALRDDKDCAQWYTDGKEWRILYFDTFWEVDTFALKAHKATIKELIEHFNHEQDTQASSNL